MVNLSELPGFIHKQISLYLTNSSIRAMACVNKCLYLFYNNLKWKKIVVDFGTYTFSRSKLMRASLEPICHAAYYNDEYHVLSRADGSTFKNKGQFIRDALFVKGIKELVVRMYTDHVEFLKSPFTHLDLFNLKKLTIIIEDYGNSKKGIISAYGKLMTSVNELILEIDTFTRLVEISIPLFKNLVSLKVRTSYGEVIIGPQMEVLVNNFLKQMKYLQCLAIEIIGHNRFCYSHSKTPGFWIQPSTLIEMISLKSIKIDYRYSLKIIDPNSLPYWIEIFEIFLYTDLETPLTFRNISALSITCQSPVLGVYNNLSILSDLAHLTLNGVIEQVGFDTVLKSPDALTSLRGYFHMSVDMYEYVVTKCVNLTNMHIGDLKSSWKTIKKRRTAGVNVYQLFGGDLEPRESRRFFENWSSFYKNIPYSNSSVFNKLICFSKDAKFAAQRIALMRRSTTRMDNLRLTDTLQRNNKLKSQYLEEDDLDFSNNLNAGSANATRFQEEVGKPVDSLLYPNSGDTTLLAGKRSSTLYSSISHKPNQVYQSSESGNKSKSLNKIQRIVLRFPLNPEIVHNMCTQIIPEHPCIRVYLWCLQGAKDMESAQELFKYSKKVTQGIFLKDRGCLYEVDVSKFLQEQTNITPTNIHNGKKSFQSKPLYYTNPCFQCVGLHSCNIDDFV